MWSRPPPLIRVADDSLRCLHTSLERDVGPGSVRTVTEGGVGWGLGGYWQWVAPVGMALTPRSHWEARGWGLVLMLCVCVCVCNSPYTVLCACAGGEDLLTP